MKIYPKYEVGDEKESAGVEKLRVDDDGKIIVKYKLGHSGVVKWKLFNASQKMVFHYELTKQSPKIYSKKMDLTKFPSGTYVLIISSQDKILRKYRIVK